MCFTKKGKRKFVLTGKISEQNRGQARNEGEEQKTPRVFLSTPLLKKLRQRR
jgi:hypothetical protein